MSFLDLATLAMHRRAEMEERMKVFESKCLVAEENLKKLKLQAKSLLGELNCDPALIKERFLNGMKTLDEYIYLVTDFNLCASKLEEAKESHPENQTEVRPELEISNKIQEMSLQTNLIDILSEPLPSTSEGTPALCKSKEVRRNEKLLVESFIQFSSCSCSQESMQQIKTENIVQCNEPIQTPVVQDTAKKEITSGDQKLLPAQTTLEMDTIYTGTIINVDGSLLWVIVEQMEEAKELMIQMSSYYNKNYNPLSLKQLSAMSYCTYYDEESHCNYRCLFLDFNASTGLAELFLVDTGELRSVAPALVQSLAPPFRDAPPFARCCHLAGVEIVENKGKEVETYLSQFMGLLTEIQVDDNSSESLGVYILLPDKTLLNDLIVDNGFAISLEPSQSIYAPPDLVEDLTAEEGYDDCPEYEDPVEAVMGYSARDEADICKHYKGGPEKTCFKGTRCKKKHIVKHPDGWTLDREPAGGAPPPAPLPPPGAWARAVVTRVCHYNALYIQFITDQTETRREFGSPCVPQNFNELTREMNSPASVSSYKPFKIAPAVGELVAAKYIDEYWYRARVIEHTAHDHSVQVRFVDYGTEMWVKESSVRQLDLAYAILPFQAIRCKLAGVKEYSKDIEDMAQAKRVLEELTRNIELDVHVISREYDELEIELFDKNKNNVAAELAASNLVRMTEYSIQDDSECRTRTIVP